MLIAFLLFVGLCFGWATSPWLGVIADKIVRRFFLAAALALVLVPLAAWAQDPSNPAVTAPQTGADWVKLIAEVIGLVLTAVVFPHLKAALQGVADSKTATSTQKAFAAGALPLEGLFELFAARYEHELESNPTTNKTELLNRAGSDLLAVLGDNGVKALGASFGALGSNLLPLAAAGIAHKIGDYQLTSATQAGLAASNKVQGASLADVAKALAAGPAAK